MQWLDILIILILCVSLIWGLKTGLLDVVFVCGGIVVGWWLSGRYADDAGELVNFSARADAFVSVLAYVFIMTACVAVFVMAGRVVKTIASKGTLGAAGAADRVAGTALGLVVGLTLSVALIVILARLAFTFTLDGTDIDIPPGGYVTLDGAQTAALVEDKRHILVDGLGGIQGRVSVPGGVWDAAPRISFGPVVGDFAVGLDLLAQRGERRRDRRICVMGRDFAAILTLYFYRDLLIWRNCVQLG